MVYRPKIEVLNDSEDEDDITLHTQPSRKSQPLIEEIDTTLSEQDTVKQSLITNNSPIHVIDSHSESENGSKSNKIGNKQNQKAIADLWDNELD